MHFSWLKTHTSLLASHRVRNYRMLVRIHAAMRYDPSAQRKGIESAEQILVSRTYRRQGQTLTGLQNQEQRESK
jgi:hypothetical protein